MNSKLRKSTAMFLASGLELASRFLGTRGFVELSTSRLLVVASFRRPSAARIFEQMKKDAIDIIIHGTQYLNIPLRWKSRLIRYHVLPHQIQNGLDCSIIRT
jgi:hypothetical protein